MNTRSLIAGLCIGLLPLSAAAVPFTYEFSGLINYASGPTPPEGEWFEPIIPFGTTFTGSFTYESETQPVFSQNGVLGYNDAITGATIRFGANGEFGVFDFLQAPMTPTSTRSSALSIVNDSELNGNPPYDQFSFSARMGTLPEDTADMYRFLSFGGGDYSAQAIPPGQTLLDPLPAEAIVANFDQLTFGYVLYSDSGEYLDDVAVGGQNISLRFVPTSVPEPATLGILAAGLLGGCLARRRRTI